MPKDVQSAIAPTTAQRIDQHAGARLRARRHALGMSQGALADKLGVSFQQVQKYERGSNRISFSTMVLAATVLGLDSISYFAEGLEGAGSDRKDFKLGVDPTAKFFAEPGAMRLAEAFVLLPDAQKRVVTEMAQGLQQAVGGKR